MEQFPLPATATITPSPSKLSASPSINLKQKVCLIAIDGWGVSSELDPKGDAIRGANTPGMNELRDKHASMTLGAHGLAVGLPDGLMGNSEVGHLNIGAGRVVYQDIVRIDLAVKKDSFLQIPAIQNAFKHALNNNGRVHFLGLVSDGGVHSHQLHLHSLLRAAKTAGIPNAFIHFFGDGRDTAPKSATSYLDQLAQFIRTENGGYGKLATVVGRYYAMDRDKRWERVEKALDMLLKGIGQEVQADENLTNVKELIEKRYSENETDEFLLPIVVNKEGIIKENDVLVFFNYRSDRMRQITASFTSDGCNGFSPLPSKISLPKNLYIISMTQYKADYPFPTLFPPQVMDNVLAEWLSKKNVPQCHIAETEKYAHVTFFFNGGCEVQFSGEDRVLVPSPKVATYDLQPEMSAIDVGKSVANRLATNLYPFVMCNFAPPDMVGHTGKYEPAVRGVEATDKAIQIIMEACNSLGYILIVTSDHGNAEKMIAENGEPHTAHTTSRVPFYVMTPPGAPKVTLRDPNNQSSSLCDVAPTILELMGLPIPPEMDGSVLTK
jgi:2,3-bisphosphoglycerate-independent phosphoglycerate mutase